MSPGVRGARWARWSTRPPADPSAGLHMLPDFVLTPRSPLFWEGRFLCSSEAPGTNISAACARPPPMPFDGCTETLPKGGRRPAAHRGSASASARGRRGKSRRSGRAGVSQRAKWAIHDEPKHARRAAPSERYARDIRRGGARVPETEWGWWGGAGVCDDGVVLGLEHQ